MSSAFELNATARADQGKGASRRLRRLAHQVPAIIYGGHKEPQAISIPHKDIAKAVQNEAFFSHIIILTVDGKKEQVVIKDLQRHPAKPIVMHADFLRVSADEKIQVKVPIHFLNEEQCKGVRLGGGSIIRNLNELDISCFPQDLPEYLELDLADLEVGDTLHISDIKLPENVESVDLAHGADSDNAVVSVQPPRGGSGENGDDDDDEASADTDEA
jgi:large subunit ribosomal protein L25